MSSHRYGWLICVRSGSMPIACRMEGAPNSSPAIQSELDCTCCNTNAVGIRGRSTNPVGKSQIVRLLLCQSWSCCTPCATHASCYCQIWSISKDSLLQYVKQWAAEAQRKLARMKPCHFQRSNLSSAILASFCGYCPYTL